MSYKSDIIFLSKAVRGSYDSRLSFAEELRRQAVLLELNPLWYPLNVFQIDPEAPGWAATCFTPDRSQPIREFIEEYENWSTNQNVAEEFTVAACTAFDIGLIDVEQLSYNSDIYFLEEQLQDVQDGKITTAELFAALKSECSVLETYRWPTKEEFLKLASKAVIPNELINIGNRVIYYDYTLLDFCSVKLQLE